MLCHEWNVMMSCVSLGKSSWVRIRTPRPRRHPRPHRQRVSGGLRWAIMRRAVIWVWGIVAAGLRDRCLRGEHAAARRGAAPHPGRPRPQLCQGMYLSLSNYSLTARCPCAFSCMQASSTPRLSRVGQRAQQPCLPPCASLHQPARSCCPKGQGPRQRTPHSTAQSAHQSTWSV